MLGMKGSGVDRVRDQGIEVVRSMGCRGALERLGASDVV